MGRRFVGLIHPAHGQVVSFARQRERTAGQRWAVLVVAPRRRQVVGMLQAWAVAARWSPIVGASQRRTFQRRPVTGSGGRSGDLLLDAVQVLQVLEVAGELGGTSGSVGESAGSRSGRRMMRMVGGGTHRQVRQ